MEAIVHGWEIVAPCSRGRAVSRYASDFNSFGTKSSRGTFAKAFTILLGNCFFNEVRSWDLFMIILSDKS